MNGHAASFSARLKPGTSGDQAAAQARWPHARGVVVPARGRWNERHEGLRWFVVVALLLSLVAAPSHGANTNPPPDSQQRAAVHGRGQRQRRRVPVGRRQCGRSSGNRHDAARARPRAGLATRPWRKRELMRRSRSAEGGCRSMQLKEDQVEGPAWPWARGARGGGVDSHHGVRPRRRTGGGASGDGPVPPGRSREGSRVRARLRERCREHGSSPAVSPIRRPGRWATTTSTRR